MQALRSLYGRLLDSLIHLAAVLAALCILSICILMVSMSLSREFGINLRGADDLIAWFCAASAFLILGQTFQHGGIVRVEIFLGRLNSAWKHRLEIIGLTIMSGFCLFAFLAFSLFVYQSWEFNDVSQGQIIVPLWIPQIFTAIGCFIFFLSVLDELIRVLHGDKPRYQQMAEERLSAGDFGETL
jgi:TRAP-type mannitol/chloroaromatic compound transport system permease small subunit